MKYQIYLKKESSDNLNELAKTWNIKPNTLIKLIIEPQFQTKQLQLQVQEINKGLNTSKLNKKGGKKKNGTSKK